jgi:Protein of unknown function (DUF3040)
VNHHTFGYHRAVLPDDAAGRPLSPTELATIADLEQRLLLDAPVAPRVRGSGPRRHEWRRSANVVPLAVLLGTGVLLVVGAAVVGGLLGAAAMLVSVVVTAFAWPLLPPTLGGPVRLRLARFSRPR